MRSVINFFYLIDYCNQSIIQINSDQYLSHEYALFLIINLKMKKKNEKPKIDVDL